MREGEQSGRFLLGGGGTRTGCSCGRLEERLFSDGSVLAQGFLFRMDRDSLQLSPDEMRSLGYRVVDLLVDHFAEGSEDGTGRSPDRGEMEARLREALPEDGQDPHTVLDQVE